MQSECFSFNVIHARLNSAEFLEIIKQKRIIVYIYKMYVVNFMLVLHILKGGKIRNGQICC